MKVWCFRTELDLGTTGLDGANVLRSLIVGLQKQVERMEKTDEITKYEDYVVDVDSEIAGEWSIKQETR